MNISNTNLIINSTVNASNTAAASTTSDTDTTETEAQISTERMHFYING